MASNEPMTPRYGSCRRSSTITSVRAKFICYPHSFIYIKGTDVIMFRKYFVNNIVLVSLAFLLFGCVSVNSVRVDQGGFMYSNNSYQLFAWLHNTSGQTLWAKVTIKTPDGAGDCTKSLEFTPDKRHQILCKQRSMIADDIYTLTIEVYKDSKYTDFVGKNVLTSSWNQVAIDAVKQALDTQ
jgi:hypothetical protein